jgi:basic amino acid/polyamine antiporter, APA family
MTDLPLAPVAERVPAATEDTSRGFGLPQAIALIMGSIIGVGVFNLPTALAPYGPITLVSFGLTTVGGVALVLGIPIYRACQKQMTQPEPVPLYR